MPRLYENPLRKNCKAHFGEQCSWDFGYGGRRLTGVSQGRQVQKRRTGPPKCGACPTPVGLVIQTKQVGGRLLAPEFYLLFGDAKFVHQFVDEHIHALNGINVDGLTQI